MNKGFWMPKGAGQVNDVDTTFGNPSRTEPKRSHEWFVDASEAELFPNKKQAVNIPNNKLSSGMSNESVSSWENTSSFQSVPQQFIDRLFGSDTASPVNFSERNISPVGSDNWNIRKGIDGQFGDGPPVSLSVTRATEDPEACPSYGGIRKIKVNQVRDSNNGMDALREHGSNRGNNSCLPTSQAFDRVNDSSFLSVGQVYDKEHGSVTLMGHAYNQGHAHVRPIGSNYGNGDEISMAENYNKGDANMISFSGFPDEQDIVSMGKPDGNYDQLYHPSSLQTSENVCEKELDPSNASAVDGTAGVTTPRPKSFSKNKPEIKTSRKQAPNSFPTNVRALIATGMLDGVPVKYVSLAREELRGIIKGVGYLCGCQLCNYTKVLNAYEFEQHAGCKTKHPNNHIYFENGKTIYQIVQELRSTPESLLFDTLQTVFGAPINQKSFKSWKESFQAATRELQRIYGKEELNL